MKNIKNILLLLAFTVLSQQAYSLTADQIIKKLDNNQLYKTQKFKMKMIIYKGSKKQVKTFWGYNRSSDKKSYIEFTNPEDRGVKYLKSEKELYIYFPDADDTMKISGHMLRQGMMGSDLSYEDMMEAENLTKNYKAKIIKTVRLNKRSCYQIQLDSINKTTIYDKQVVFVDKARFTANRIEMFARGGRLIKVMTQEQFRRKNGIYYARFATIKDTRNRDSKTVVQTTSIQFNSRVPARYFRKSALRK